MNLSRLLSLYVQKYTINLLGGRMYITSPYLFQGDACGFERKRPEWLINLLNGQSLVHTPLNKKNYACNQGSKINVG